MPRGIARLKVSSLLRGLALSLYHSALNLVVAALMWRLQGKTVESESLLAAASSGQYLGRDPGHRWTCDDRMFHGLGGSQSLSFNAVYPTPLFGDRCSTSVTGWRTMTLRLS